MATRKVSLFKISLLLLILFFLGTSLLLGLFYYAVVSLEELPEPQIALTTSFYDNNGELLTTIYRENRFETPLEDMPLALQQAVIAAEDAYFYQHPGVNLLSLARATWRNLENRRIVEGGSTITQQLAKNLFLSHERTYRRKVDELVLTLHLEREYTKEEILNMYLNIVYFGRGAYGAEAAARTFFDKPLGELSLGEISYLAGLPQAPSIYSRDLEAAKNRQAYVLARMVELGYISTGDRNRAREEPLVFREGISKANPAGYFLDYVIYHELVGRLHYGLEELYQGGLHVYTTLDPFLQSAGERALAGGLQAFPGLYRDHQGLSQPQGALVALEPGTGKVLAMVGGNDYGESTFNRATSRRSPGSAFKPFLYAAALDSGFTAATLIRCEPVSFPIPGSENWEPRDFGGDFHHRELTLREAVEKSCNVCAAKVIMEVGPEKVAGYAKMMGISSPLRQLPSLALGTSEVTLLEMTNAYATLANGGTRVDPVFITRITDYRGQLLYQDPPNPRPALDEKVAFLLVDILQGVLQPGGTGWRASQVLEHPAAGKTGTSSEFRDAYMVGFTPDLAAGVYLGDDHHRGLGDTGGSLATPVWADFMAQASNKYPPGDFPPPGEGIVRVTLCRETGLPQGTRCRGPALEELFIQGTQPRHDCGEAYCPHLEPERPWWHFQFPWFNRD